MNEWLDAPLQWAVQIGLNAYTQALVVAAVFAIAGAFVGLAAGIALRRILRAWPDGPRTGLVRLTRRTIFRAAALVGLILAAMLPGFSARAEAIVISLLETLLVFVVAAFLIRGGRLLIDITSQRAAPPPWARPATVPLLNNLMQVLLILAGAYAILVAWDINATGLVASAGIVGLALSFAAQDTLGNLFAGIAILTDQPYRIGDYIVLDSGERGQVTHIGLRSTRLLTRDDEEVSIPNGIMGRAKIVNESGGPHVKYRLRVPVGIAYGSDIDHVMAVLLRVAAGHPGVCQQPEPRVRLRQFSDSAIQFELLVWIAQPALRGLALHELNCEVYRTFQREGIVIPFPQLDVHLRGPVSSPPG